MAPACPPASVSIVPLYLLSFYICRMQMWSSSIMQLMMLVELSITCTAYLYYDAPVCVCTITHLCVSWLCWNVWQWLVILPVLLYICVSVCQLMMLRRLTMTRRQTSLTVTTVSMSWLEWRSTLARPTAATTTASYETDSTRTSLDRIAGMMMSHWVPVPCRCQELQNRSGLLPNQLA